MDLKTILRHMADSFFVIFTGAMLSMYAIHVAFGLDTMPIHNIGVIFVMTCLTDLAWLIFWSRTELSRRGMLCRYILHIIALLAIVLGTARFMGWISLRNPVEVAIFVATVVIVYTLVSLTEFLKSKKLADRLNEKLKERNK